jgi:hypothetical protein
MKRLAILALLLASACAPLAPYSPIPAWQGTTYPGGTYPASNLSEGGNPDKGSDGL